jgi:ATP-binding cassette subfamily C (CFTR/MRP) protein 1
MAEPTEKELEEFESLGKVTDDNDGRIIKDENKEIVNVEWSSYHWLIKLSGGYVNVIMLQLILSGFVYCKIQNDYTVGLWAADLN